MMTKIKKNKLHACGTWTNNLEIYFRKCIHKNLIKLVKHFVSFNLKESFWFGECFFSSSSTGECRNDDDPTYFPNSDQMTKDLLGRTENN